MDPLSSLLHPPGQPPPLAHIPSVYISYPLSARYITHHDEEGLGMSRFLSYHSTIGRTHLATSGLLQNSSQFYNIKQVANERINQI